MTMRDGTTRTEAHLGAVSWLAQGPLFVNAWWDAPRARELDAILDAQLKAYEGSGKLGVVTLIRPSFVPHVDEATRKASARIRRELEPTYVSSAFLIDSSGFLAAITRSVLSGIHALSRAPYPTFVHTDVLEIARFTERELATSGKQVDVATVISAVDRISLGAR